MPATSKREVSGETPSITTPERITAPRHTRLAGATAASPRENPGDTLGQMLKRALSTGSPNLVSRQRAAVQPEKARADLRTIGLGSCGTVFEIPGTYLAFKKGTSEAGIWQDLRLTNKVHNAVRRVRTNMQRAFPNSTIPKTPQCHEYHRVDDQGFWFDELQRFPAGHRTKQPLFTVDRILPLPQELREGLIEEYFDEDEEVQQEAKDHPDNKDCLVRIYLGERESVRHQSDGYDSLRNFPLRLNMMEYMEVEVSQLAEEMAIGLAIMHWQAQVDAMDVEFVLGSSTTWDTDRPDAYVPNGPPHSFRVINFKRRAMHLWMFDFDKATEIELTKHDVDTKLVPAFLGNDPYYPRPQVDEELWKEFCGVYLKASEVVLRGKRVDEQVRGLPQRFLNEVLRVSREHEGWNEEDNIVFAD